MVRSRSYFRSSPALAGITSQVYSRTAGLTSYASSSLDKPAGTLSGRTSGQLALAGQSAQNLIQTIPRQISKDYTAGMRSYAYTAGLLASDPFLSAQEQLMTKFIAQASPQQQQQLVEASRSQSVGLQRAAIEVVRDAQEQNRTLKGVGDLSRYGLLALGLILAWGLSR